MSVQDDDWRFDLPPRRARTAAEEAEAERLLDWVGRQVAGRFNAVNWSLEEDLHYSGTSSSFGATYRAERQQITFTYYPSEERWGVFVSFGPPHEPIELEREARTLDEAFQTMRKELCAPIWVLLGIPAS